MSAPHESPSITVDRNAIGEQTIIFVFANGWRVSVTPETCAASSEGPNGQCYVLTDLRPEGVAYMLSAAANWEAEA